MIQPVVQGFFDSVTGTWTYVVHSEEADRRCAVIDSVLDYEPFSGRVKTTSADKVLAYIAAQGLELQWILETHIHADHLTAAAYLQQKLGGKTAISCHILDVLKAWQPVFEYAGDTPLDGSQFDHVFADDEAFKIGALDARIIPTPGHTPADSAYIIGENVFVGDALFLPDVGTGRCDFPGGSAVASYESTQKILALPHHYRVYVGHDYPPAGARAPEFATSILAQKQTNVRVNSSISKAEYVAKRNSDDVGKDVPKLLLPALQVNLRAGKFSQTASGMQYIQIPINRV